MTRLKKQTVLTVIFSGLELRRRTVSLFIRSLNPVPTYVLAYRLTLFLPVSARLVLTSTAMALYAQIFKYCLVVQFDWN